MKLTKDDLDKENLTVWVKTSQDEKAKQVALPESVDLTTGTVSMWIIPVEEKSNLLEKKTLDVRARLPETTDVAVLKTVAGKIFLVDKDGKVTKESL